MDVDWKLIVDLANGLAWPIVAAVALAFLRRPLVELVAQIARRTRKLSVYNVSLEFAALPELEASWPSGSNDVRRLMSNQIFDSASQTLFTQLMSPTEADYAVVDLGQGKEWLTSRLFVFAVILGQVRGLRAFVFVETAGQVRKRYLGVASPDNIRRGLGARYPWLEEAYARALAGRYGAALIDTPQTSMFSDNTPSLSSSEAWQLSNFAQSFVMALQRSTEPPGNQVGSYLKVGTDSPTWERAHWIDGQRLERDLTGLLEYAWCEDSPDQPKSQVRDAILRRSGTFVALVDGDRRFHGLVDRGALLDRMWRESEDGRDNAEEA